MKYAAEGMLAHGGRDRRADRFRVLAAAVRASLLLALTLGASAAQAQSPAAAVMPYPLDLLRAPREARAAGVAELKDELKQALRRAEVPPPDMARSETALKQLARDDCDRENACLQQLAQQAGTLYAIYASLDFTLDQRVVASGRVVRDDGTMMGEVKTVTLRRGKTPFKEVAKRAVDELVVAMGVKALPPTRPVEPPPAAAPRPAEPPPSPPPVVIREPSPSPVDPNAGPPVQLLALSGLKPVGLSDDQGAFYSEHLAQQLSLRGLRVVSPAQVAVVLGQARQRELLGCEEGSSCVAEIGGALGAQAIITGTVARAGRAFQLDVVVLGANDAGHLALFSRRVDREEDLLPATAEAADSIAARLGATWQKAPAPPPRRTAALATGAVGAAALGISAGLLFAASTERAKLTSPSLSYEDAVRARDNGKLFQNIGFVGLGVGAAALGVATVLWLVGAPSSPVEGALLVSDRSFFFVLGGRWP